MFPWVYGFTWSLGNVIFLGIFFTVVSVIGATVILSLLRAYRSLHSRHAEAIRWESEFHDLPASARSCRHEFTGEFKQRTCNNAFDCRNCETHQALMLTKTSNTDEIEAPVHAYGYTIPLDRLYHRGHTWVKSDSTGTYTVGLDDFASRLIGSPESIELPKSGTHLQVNGTAWKIKKGALTERILSPLEGEVVATNDGSDGWYLKIKPITVEVNTSHLLRDKEVPAWLMREFERLQERLADPKIGVTLADGGSPVMDMIKAYPDRNWDGILSEMFLES